MCRDVALLRLFNVVNSKKHFILMTKSLVILSGGQDSTTCLYWSIKKFGRKNVSSITFDYGQRHKIELKCAKKIASIAGISNKILPIDTFNALGGNSLTDKNIAVKDDEIQANQIPNTFVPARNLIFITFAAAYAYNLNIHHLVTGVAQTDYSGYPDCRENTIKSMQTTLSLGMDYEIEIHTPLMYKSKKETVELADNLGALEAMRHTHTCYNGQQPPCGHCQSCCLRAKGFTEAGIDDPLLQK
jgi:7-cyano-7-deazaguanine synthase